MFKEKINEMKQNSNKKNCFMIHMGFGNLNLDL